MTDKRDEYVVRLSGVDVGTHKYTMVCDKAFFELTGLNEIEDGSIKVLIEMEKSATMLSFQLHFKGEITVICDRCLDFLTLPLDFTDFLVVNLVSQIDESFENDDNIWQLHEKAYELDLTHFLYETIELALPTQLIHSEENNCNPEMLQKLAEFAPKEEQQATETDPRWDALKNLKI
ncbi:MAG: DUF177 domain-containing protein [Bacteroidetes bacterium]|nr:DUF177 domain-containing protein [Bacteroidota bacterium]MCL2303306.1 DUF177 domain-containing protein [Lentimicrobiaceae bacterium]